MIGVALVVFVAVFASSIKASAADVLVELLPSDLTISSTNFATGVSPQYSEDLRELPEISEVTALAVTQVKVDEVVYDASVIEPETVGGLFDLEVSDESLADLEATDGVLISSQEPGYEAWIGSTIDIELPTGVVETAEVVGSFDVQNFGTFLLTRDRYAAGVDTFWDSFVAANVAEGVSIEAARTAAEDLAMDYPNVQVQTVSEVLADAESQIDQILVIFTVLLAFAIIIAVLGITNTLALSIIERTHEIGLLRAVGMVRRQVRRMIRWEGVVVAVFGAVLGILTGLLLGWAVVQALADEGLGQFSIPFVQLAIYIVIAALAGVIAAAYPARKAARLNVLEAIAYE
jgi:putative ABC transport system permease protein